jgi:hypothetical protein
MNLRKIKLGGMNWIHPAQDMDQRGAIVNILMNFLFPLPFWESLE